MNINIIKEENEITIIEPLDTSLPILAKNPSFEGLYIIFKNLDEIEDTITLMAYSGNSKKLRKYMNDLNDETLFITNIPKQTGVYYLGGI